MVEPVSPSRHPVGDRLRAAADRIEQHAAGWPWVAVIEPVLAAPLAQWLRSAGDDAEDVGADIAALAVADAILGGTL